MPQENNEITKSLNDILEELKKSNEFLKKIKESSETEKEIKWPKYAATIPILTGVVAYAYNNLKFPFIPLALIYIAVMAAIIYSDWTKIRTKINLANIRANAVWIFILILFVAGLTMIVTKLGWI